MSNMEMIVKLVEILAWPIVLLIILGSFRKTIVGLIPELSKFKSGAFELEFDKSAAKIDEISPEVYENSESSEFEPILDKLESSPRVVIIEYWIKLLDEVQNLQKNKFTEQSIEKATSIEIGNFLAKNEILNSKGLKLYHELRKVRNMAVHQTDAKISTEQARYFAKHSGRLLGHIRSL